MKIKYFQYCYIALVIFYLAAAALTPIDADTMTRYELSEPQVRLIGLSVSIPLALIWLVALYGYSRFKSYSDLIADEKEGKAFGDMSKGLMVLVASLPVGPLINMIVRRLSENRPELEIVANVAASYIPVAFQLVAFVLLARGAVKLLATLRPKFHIVHSPAVMLGLLAFAALFTYVIVARPFGGSIAENYSMPTWLVMITIVIPLLYAWYMGGLAIYSLFTYRHRTHGVVYRKLLDGMVAGLAAIVILSILIQILTSVAEQLVRLNFTPLLGIIYLLIALYAVGYGMLAQGARQLRKIEEV